MKVRNLMYFMEIFSKVHTKNICPYTLQYKMQSPMTNKMTAFYIL